MRPRRPPVRLRPVTPDSYVEGCWVRHVTSGTWFEAWELEADRLVGIDLHDALASYPMGECLHAFDRTLDG